jgi:hypothetical protein
MGWQAEQVVCVIPLALLLLVAVLAWMDTRER